MLVKNFKHFLSILCTNITTILAEKKWNEMKYNDCCIKKIQEM